ncbi:cation:proton antiporter domain-containing protein [Brachybacterium hainanense]|uniref:Cation:proton antiporter n=1 Tax=Brachybacterium hainanense TaxID=1541174 RepID=A0ABV6R738_9MICO
MVVEIATTLGAALVLGLLAHLLRIPPLVGFLVAGFLLGGFGVGPFPGLAEASQLGVTLLLFTIGLKFDVRTIWRPEAFGTALIHMVLSVLAGAVTLALAGAAGLAPAGIPWRTLALIGFALSFCSTVLCVKVLEDRSDDGSLYGQIAIAILVIQDIAAVAFLSAAEGRPPSPWALALVLLVPASWLLRRMLERVGWGELLILFGVATALGPGYELFELVGITGDLGALVMGMLLASHPRALDLSKALFGVKELLLVGFFLTIGLEARPHPADLGLALLLCLVLLPVTILGFAALSRLFGLRNRTALRIGLVLGNFSEFSVIVAAVGVHGGLLEERWLAVIAIAVAGSMVISSLLNARAAGIVGRIAERLPAADPARLRPADRPIDTTGVDVVVFGMGRVGRATYERLHETGERQVLGVDNDHGVVERLRAEGYRVLEGDATDLEFWHRIRAGGFVQTVILAMPIHDSNVFALQQLREADFDGTVAAVAQHQDQVEHLEAEGVGSVLNLYSGAGIALADLALPPEEEAAT